jgi:hypothetical protein
MLCSVQGQHERHGGLVIYRHDALQRGATLPEALLAARKATSDDPLAEATAHSFVALGA